jgi:hypothetical protein
MKKMIPLILLILIIITTVLFFINIKEKNLLFFYRLGLTILFETIFVVWIAISSDYKDMKAGFKIAFILFVFIMTALEFITLFFGTSLFKLQMMSKTMTTMMLAECGIEILAGLILFAFGNLVSNKKA